LFRGCNASISGRVQRNRRKNADLSEDRGFSAGATAMRYPLSSTALCRSATGMAVHSLGTGIRCPAAGLSLSIRFTWLKTPERSAAQDLVHVHFRLADGIADGARDRPGRNGLEAFG
jgi:hypothetical protein